MARRICLCVRRRSTSFQLGCSAASSTTPLHTDVPSPGPTGGGTTSTSCQSTVVSPPCCSSLLFAWLDSTFSTTTLSSTTGTRSTTGKRQPPWILPSQLQRSPAPQEPEVPLVNVSLPGFYLLNYNALQHHRNQKYHW